MLAVLVAACLPQSAHASQSGERDAALSAVMTVYVERADPARHAEAFRGFKDLAARYPGDYDLQIWCTRTSFYYAHRRVQNDDKKGCAGAARAGIDCSRRALKIRKDDYTARYWELMNRMKAGATLSIVSALKAVKPLKAQLERLIARDPNRFEGYLFLGMLYRELPSLVSWGDDDKALVYVKKAERLAPRDPDVLLEVAEAYYKLDNEAMAIAYFRKVARSDVSKHLEWETGDARRWAKKRLKEIE